MKTKLAGLIIGMGMSLTAPAEIFHFGNITDPGNPVLQSLGNQLTMEVTNAGDDRVLFTFSNNASGGDLDSSIARIYFDDAPSNLFQDVRIGFQSEGVDFTPTASPSNLPGPTTGAYGFAATDSFDAAIPRTFLGINNAAVEGGEEFLTLSAVLNPGKTFSDVVRSLSAGALSSTGFLRVGLHVIAIDRFREGANASFLELAATPPPPIPEPGSLAMTLAGLGLMGIIARRRRSGL